MGVNKNILEAKPGLYQVPIALFIEMPCPKS